MPSTSSTAIQGCFRCHRKLEGSYLEALNQKWHPECFRCTACGEKLQASFSLQGDEPYHPDCYDQCFGMRCEICGKVIRDQYFQQDNKYYCPRDFEDHVVPKCFQCQRPLLKGTFSNEWGQDSCEAHRTRPTCTSCGRWLRTVDQEQATASQGAAELCPGCAVDRVGPQELLSYGPAFSQRVFRAAGLDWCVPDIRLRLVDARDLNPSRSKPSDRAIEGLIKTLISSLDQVESGRTIEEILIIDGLTRDHFEGVLAHEYGHAWLFEHHVDGLTQTEQEGFCEWIKYHWLRHLRTPLSLSLAQRLAGDPDPIYGGGFRLVQHQFENTGLAGLMECFGLRV